MIEIKDVTVYKCEHCAFTGTFKNVVQKHEEKCLINQDKTSKNIDKQEIYNLLDTDIINIKIKEFIEKYNLPIASEIEFVKIIIDNSFLPYLEIEQSIRGIFDRTKFKLHNELSNLRYSKEYLTKDVVDVMEWFSSAISKQMEVIDSFISCKRAKIKFAISDYLKRKINE